MKPRYILLVPLIGLFIGFTLLLSTYFLQYDESIVSASEPVSNPICEQHRLIFYGIFTTAKRVEQRNFFRTLHPPNSVTVRFIVGLSDDDLSKEISEYNDILILPVTENVDDGKTYAYFDFIWRKFGCFQYYFKATDDTAINFERLADYVERFETVEPMYIGHYGSNNWTYTRPNRTAVVDLNGIRIYDVDIASISKRYRIIWNFLGAWIQNRFHSMDFYLHRGNDYFFGWCYGVNRAALRALLRLRPTEVWFQEDLRFGSWMRAVGASFRDVGARFHHRVPPPDRPDEARRCLFDWYCAETGRRSIAVHGLPDAAGLRAETARLRDDARPAGAWVGVRLAGQLGNQLFLLASAHGIAAARGARACVATWDNFLGGDAVEMAGGGRPPECPGNVTYVFATEGLEWQRFHPRLMRGLESVVAEDFLQSYKSAHTHRAPAPRRRQHHFLLSLLLSSLPSLYTLQNHHSPPTPGPKAPLRLSVCSS